MAQLNTTPISCKKKNPIFKNPVPAELLWDFLLNNFDNKDKYVLLNKFLFKKTEYNEHIKTFIMNLKPYYHENKEFYVERELNYNKFMTVIRQICNVLSIAYASKMVYDKSSYEIEYYIYKP